MGFSNYSSRLRCANSQRFLQQLQQRWNLHSKHKGQARLQRLRSRRSVQNQHKQCVPLQARLRQKWGKLRRLHDHYFPKRQLSPDGWKLRRQLQYDERPSKRNGLRDQQLVHLRQLALGKQVPGLVMFRQGPQLHQHQDQNWRLNTRPYTRTYA